jgi:transposase
MEIAPAQYAQTESFLPVQSDNVNLDNLQVLNAILCVAEQDCKWRGLPKRFGNWYTIYTRMNRWAKADVLDRGFEQLQRQQIVRVKVESVALDSPIIRVHPDGTGALKKTARKLSADAAADGPLRVIWVPRMLETAIGFALSPGQDHDAPTGRALLRSLGPTQVSYSMLMDRA